MPSSTRPPLCEEKALPGGGVGGTGTLIQKCKIFEPYRALRCARVIVNPSPGRAVTKGYRLPVGVALPCDPPKQTILIRCGTMRASSPTEF
ncbi:MAG: hypothetical protein FWD58_03290 [Firmicutes bacterium]|nr:hypothetical protein [Bacillota bacterium]